MEEREEVFGVFLNEAKTRRVFVTVFDMLAGLDGFAVHMAAMAKLCMESRPHTENSLLFTVAILSSPATRAVMNALLTVVPPSKPLYIAGSQEEAWKIVTGEGMSSAQLWRPEQNQVAELPPELQVSM